MVCQELSFHSIKPFVRFAQDIYLTAEQPPKTVKAYDHRLFYIVSGTALLEINNITKEISPGHVLYWMSGAPYIFNVCSNHALHMISINFDFTQNNCQTVQYLPMVLHTDYDEHKQLESIAFTDATVLNNPIILNDLPGILPYMQNIVSEAASPALFSDFHLSNLLSVILCATYIVPPLSAKWQKGKPALTSKS